MSRTDQDILVGIVINALKHASRRFCDPSLGNRAPALLGNSHGRGRLHEARECNHMHPVLRSTYEIT